MIAQLSRALADPPRRILLAVCLPLIAMTYFGSLALAAWHSPQGYDWRHQAISKLLYPAYDPEFHYVASLGIALTGLLMLPIGVYIRRKLCGVSAKMAGVGISAFAAGAIGLLLAGLIVSHPARGTVIFPRLHEILARAAAAALGASVLLLWICAVKGYFLAGRQWRWLAISWSVVTLPALAIIVLRVAAAVRLNWQNPLYAALQNRALWHLGFWEWLGSAAMFVFIVSAVLFMPE
jgi:hypothetical protein